MKEPKNVGKFAYAVKQIKLNQAGMTLAELMVAAGASMVVLLGVAVVMNMGMREFATIFEQNKTMESVEQAAYMLKIITQNAVNVRGSVDNVWSDATDPTAGFVGVAALPDGNPGFDSTLAPAGNVVANNGKAYKLATFLVENGSYSNADASAGPHTFTNLATNVEGSMFRAIGIWYQVPDSTKAGPLSSGALWIKTNAQGVVTPSQKDLSFNRISAFKMEVIPTPASTFTPTGPAYKIVFTITGRYFRNADKSQWTYDNLPNTCTAGCVDMEPRSVEVNLRDNALATSQIAADGVIERSQGPLYYFQLHAPRSGQFVQALPP